MCFFRASIPEQVTYKARENTKEEITKETDIGPEVTHLYEVGIQSNMGHDVYVMENGTQD